MSKAKTKPQLAADRRKRLAERAQELKAALSQALKLPQAEFEARVAAFEDKRDQEARARQKKTP